MNAPDSSHRLLTRDLTILHERTDRAFAWLLLAQWALAIIVAVLKSPYTWEGARAAIHPHLPLAIIGGAAINALPIALIVWRRGHWVTRHAVAVAQMLWSAMLIHVTGGRIETHFHVFGSLAFLAFYRDWRVVVTATLVTISDHLARGLFWPESVYGMANPEWWRFIEHSSWVIFEDVVLMFGCRRQLAEMSITAQRESALSESHERVERLVDERTSQLRVSAERYRQLVENTGAVPWELDGASGRFVYLAPQGVAMFPLSGAGGFTRPVWSDVCEEDRQRVMMALTGGAASAEGHQFDLDMRLNGTAGVIDVRSTISSHTTAHGIMMRGISLDISTLRRLELELRHAQRLESVGRLASGVAHEINTPVQFVTDSVLFIREAARDLTPLMREYHALCGELSDDPRWAERRARIAQMERDADIEYVVDNLGPALERSLDGLGRVSGIVRSMKEFAHPDTKTMTTIDLNQAIESTLIVAKHEYKYVADIVRDLGDVPPVRCHAGDVNQVLVNILVNAAHAIADVTAGSDARGTITVSTRQDGDAVVVGIADSGGGIPEAIRGRIFEPFFTTKAVGRGTGQGLALAHRIVARHGGDLTFESTPGAGTTFYMRLPIEPARPDGDPDGVEAAPVAVPARRPESN